MSEPRKPGWFSKIESREEALKVVKDASGGFFVVAAIQGGIGIFLAPSLLFDAAMYASGGYLLRRFNSRLIASALLVFALASAGTTVANRLGAGMGGGNNVILAAIIVWAAIRAVQATVALQGRFSRVAELENTRIALP